MGEAPTLPGICAKFSSPYKLLLIEIFTNSCQFIEAPAVIVQPSTDSSLSMYLTQSSATDSLKIELVFSPRITAFLASIDCSFCFRSAVVTSK